MRNSFTILFIFLGFVFSGLDNLYAQASDTLNIHGYKEKINAMTMKMERELSLMGSQVRQVENLLEKRFIAFKELENNKTGKRQYDQTAREELKHILTPKQFAYYKELRADTKKKKKGFLRKHPGYQFSEEDEVLDF